MQAWLAARGLGEDVLRANRVGADPGPAALERPRGLPRGGPAVILPVLGVDGDATYLQARYLHPRGHKYDNPSSALAGPLPRATEVRAPHPPTDPNLVMVTEGIPDALVAAQAGYRAAAVLGAGLIDERAAAALAERFPTERLVIAFDADERGIAGGERLHELLAGLGAEARVGRLEVPHAAGDLNGWQQAAGAAFGTEIDTAVARTIGTETAMATDPARGEERAVRVMTNEEAAAYLAEHPEFAERVATRGRELAQRYGAEPATAASALPAAAQDPAGPAGDVAHSRENTGPLAANGAGDIAPPPVDAVQWHQQLWPEAAATAVAANHDLVVQQMEPSGPEKFGWWITRTADSIDAMAGGLTSALHRPRAEGTAPTAEDGIRQVTVAGQRLGLIAPGPVVVPILVTPEETAAYLADRPDVAGRLGAAPSEPSMLEQRLEAMYFNFVLLDDPTVVAANLARMDQAVASWADPALPHATAALPPDPEMAALDARLDEVYRQVFVDTAAPPSLDAVRSSIETWSSEVAGTGVTATPVTVDHIVEQPQPAKSDYLAQGTANPEGRSVLSPQGDRDGSYVALSRREGERFGMELSAAVAQAIEPEGIVTIDQTQPVAELLAVIRSDHVWQDDLGRAAENVLRVHEALGSWADPGLAHPTAALNPDPTMAGLDQRLEQLHARVFVEDQGQTRTNVDLVRSEAAEWPGSLLEYLPEYASIDPQGWARYREPLEAAAARSDGQWGALSVRPALAQRLEEMRAVHVMGVDPGPAAANMERIRLAVDTWHGWNAPPRHDGTEELDRLAPDPDGLTRGLDRQLQRIYEEVLADPDWASIASAMEAVGIAVATWSEDLSLARDRSPTPLASLEWHNCPAEHAVAAAAGHYDLVVHRPRPTGPGAFDWYVANTAVARPVAEGVADSLADGMAHALTAATDLGLVVAGAHVQPPGPRMPSIGAEVEAYLAARPAFAERIAQRGRELADQYGPGPRHESQGVSTATQSEPRADFVSHSRSNQGGGVLVSDPPLLDQRLEAMYVNFVLVDDPTVVAANLDRMERALASWADPALPHATAALPPIRRWRRSTLVSMRSTATCSSTPGSHRSGAWRRSAPGSRPGRPR